MQVLISCHQPNQYIPNFILLFKTIYFFSYSLDRYQVCNNGFWTLFRIQRESSSTKQMFLFYWQTNETNAGKPGKPSRGLVIFSRLPILLPKLPSNSAIVPSSAAGRARCRQFNPNLSSVYCLLPLKLSIVQNNSILCIRDLLTLRGLSSNCWLQKC